MRILYISDVVPAEVNAGYALMHRHLRKLEGYVLKVVTAQIPRAEGKQIPGDPVFVPPRSRNYLRVAHRIGRRTFWMEREAARIRKLARPVVEEFKPDVVVTVMSSAFVLAAADLADEFRCPLVLVCHDDFEFMMNPKDRDPQWTSRRLGAVYNRAAVRLCVGPGMAEHLARRFEGPVGEVLYPIPDDKPVLAQPRARDASKPLRLGFFGELGGNYETMTLLVDALQECAAELHFFSHSSGWQRQTLCARPGVKDCGFAKPEDLRAYIAQKVDAIVIPQGFDRDYRILRETCFPSKLPEASRIGLPLLILAPPYGSAARWGREHLPPESVVSELSVAPIKNALDMLADPSGWMRCRDAVVSAAAMFEPDLLQEQFEKALQRAVSQR